MSSKIELPPEAPGGSLHAYHLFVVRHRDGAEARRRLYDGLRERGIRAQVHYVPVYLHPYYRDAFGYEPGLCPEAERYYAGCLSLPCFPALTDEEQQHGHRSGPGARLVAFPAEFRIGEHPVGPGHPAYVIAEAGANHNRDLDTAKRLIDAAAEAGADAIKFQTYSGKRIYSSKTPRFKYLEGLSDKAPAELLEEVELPREWQPQLAEYASERGIDFFSTPFDHEAVRELARARRARAEDRVVRDRRSPADPKGRRNRLAAPDLDRHGDAGRDRGGAGRGQRGGRPAVGLMQCTSVYPAPAERANLRAMKTMRDAFGLPVGLSDHTTGIVGADRSRGARRRLCREALHPRPADAWPRPSLRARAR